MSLNAICVFVFVMCEGKSSDWTSRRSHRAGCTRCRRNHEIQASCKVLSVWTSVDSF